MAISEHVKAAYRDLSRWLEHARGDAAARYFGSVDVDVDFATAADRFVTSIKLESGTDEVARRAKYLAETSGDGSDYQRIVEKTLTLGVGITKYYWESLLKNRPIVKPIHSPHFIYSEWRRARRILSDEGKRLSQEQLAALNEWISECDRIVKISTKLRCAGCSVLLRSAALLPLFQQGLIRGRIGTIDDLLPENRRVRPLSLRIRSIRETKAAMNSLKRWLIRRQRSDRLTKKQRAALEVIKTKGPIKGMLIARQIDVSESTFRTHYLPVLRKHGVKNDGDGYYIGNG